MRDPFPSPPAPRAEEPSPPPHENPRKEERPAARPDDGGPGASRGSSGTSAAVKERPRPAPPKPGHLPPWRVLLHNDDDSPMDFVMLTLMELAALDEQRAFAVMMEAHRTGVGLVLVTHKERAELYRDQFACKSLTVTIEPAE